MSPLEIVGHSYLGFNPRLYCKCPQDEKRQDELEDQARRRQYPDDEELIADLRCEIVQLMAELAYLRSALGVSVTLA